MRETGRRMWMDVGCLMYANVHDKISNICRVKEGQWRGTFFTVVTLKHKIHFSKLLIHFSRDSDLANDLSITTRMFIGCSTAEVVSR